MPIYNFVCIIFFIINIYSNKHLNEFIYLNLYAGYTSGINDTYINNQKNNFLLYCLFF